jgi:hypothetical protein
VKQLEDAVQKTVTAAGPAAVDALASGRQATIAKYRAAGILKELNKKGVGAYKQLTAPHDGNLELLEQVQEFAPAHIPEIGRAKLQAWLDLATEADKFAHADKLYAEWRKLGAGTKAILYSAPGQVRALDQFFLLAKRIGENPNPSGTAAVNNVFNWFSTVGTLPIAKLLYTPGGAKALTRLLTLTPAAPSLATRLTVAQRAAWAEVAASARSAGVPLTLPQAASTDPTDTSAPGTPPQ